MTSNYISEFNKQKSELIAYQKIMEYYKILSYKSFYRKVLGEKIKDTIFDDENDTVKKSKYRKTENGEFIRNETIDKIDNLNNSLLIVDEAHNITGNNYTDAIKKIIENSKNLKIVLMTATPMKNSADDIIDLINLLKPKDEQITKGKVFTSKSTYQIDFNENGEEIFKKYIKGCVSYLRGGDPYIFASKNEQGIITDNLKFTKIIPCKMLNFQNNI
jgi:superfamily II DNA or RNA helicase